VVHSFLRFELFDECSEPRGNGSCESVVLVFEAFPNCGHPNVSIASGIQPAPRGMVLKPVLPTNPMIDPVGCGSEIAHGPLPHVSASRSD
jgi:hypothetical protein